MAELRTALEAGCRGKTRDLIRWQLPLVKDYTALDKWAQRSIMRSFAEYDLYSAGVTARTFLLATLEGPIRWILWAVGHREKPDMMGALEQVVAAEGCPAEIKSILTGKSLKERLLANQEQVVAGVPTLTVIQQDALIRARLAIESMEDLHWTGLRNALAHYQVMTQQDGTMVWFLPNGTRGGSLPVEALLLYAADLRTLAFDGVTELADIMSSDETQ